jgi:hypothetical protein
VPQVCSWRRHSAGRAQPAAASGLPVPASRASHESTASQAVPLRCCGGRDASRGSSGGQWHINDLKLGWSNIKKTELIFSNIGDIKTQPF